MSSIKDLSLPRSFSLASAEENQEYTSRVFQRISDVPFEDWTSVYPQVLEGFNFFKSLDESGLSQFSLRYIVVYKDDVPVGAATCFLMDYSIDTTVQGFFKKPLQWALRQFPNLFKLKALMCGQPVGPGRIGLRGDNAVVFKEIQKCLEKIAEEERAAIIVFKEFEETYSSLFRSLERDGYYKFESIPNTVKSLSFKSFEEYLMSLSYATRYDLKRKFKKVDGKIDISLEITGRLNGALDDAYGLYRQMVARHNMGLEIMPKEFFARVSENMPNETKFFLWRVDGKLVAFAFCLVSGDYFLDQYLGLDYALAHDYHLYFVRFRDMMTWCTKNNIKTYEMGCTNYDPKKRLDFKFVPLNIYAKFRNRRLNHFTRYICEMIAPKKHDPFFKAENRKNSAPKNGLTLGLFSLVLANEAVDIFAQIMMKKGLPHIEADFWGFSKTTEFLSLSAASPFVRTGLLVYVANFFIWILIVAQLDLSMAVPLTSINYALLPVLAMWFLNEKISLLRWGGISLIALGVYLISKTDVSKKTS